MRLKTVLVVLLGVDARYRFTPSLGLGLALDPNFLEVEADPTEKSINDPFTPLDPEKRAFFSEGINVFGTPFEMVYTRNIEDPQMGLKPGSKAGDVATGDFLTHDRELSVIVPGNMGSSRVDFEEESHSAAARYRYDLRPGIEVGALTTLALLFAWKPTQRNTFSVGAEGVAEEDDEIRDLTFSEYTFYIKYERPFRP